MLPTPSRSQISLLEKQQKKKPVDLIWNLCEDKNFRTKHEKSEFPLLGFP